MLFGKYFGFILKFLSILLLEAFGKIDLKLVLCISEVAPWSFLRRNLLGNWPHGPKPLAQGLRASHPYIPSLFHEKLLRIYHNLNIYKLSYNSFNLRLY
jgi:hypothetical protein